MKRQTVNILTAVLLSSLCHSSLVAQSKLRIAVIPKGTTHVFWKSVEAGAKAAAKELGVEKQYLGEMDLWLKKLRQVNN